MRLTTRAILTAATLSVGLVAVPGSAQATLITWNSGTGHNNHWYEAVFVPSGISWINANAAANAAGGYLATLTSAEENAFVFNLAFTNPTDPNSLWEGNLTEAVGPWLGGTDATTEGVWEWVTGESWGFTKWSSGQPNDVIGDADGQNYLHFYYYPSIDSTWNDLGERPPIYGYIIEWNNNPASVPEPATLGLLGLGLLGLAASRRRKQ